MTQKRICSDYEEEKEKKEEGEEGGEELVLFSCGDRKQRGVLRKGGEW